MKHYSDVFADLIKDEFQVKYLHVSACKHPLSFCVLKKLIKLTRFLRKYKPTTIHINSGHPYLFFLYPFMLKYKRVITVHDIQPHEGESILKRVYHRIHLEFISYFYDTVIVHTKSIKDNIASKRLSDKAKVIPHPYFPRKAKRHIKNTDTWTILFFGRILKYKGLDILLKAFSTLDKRKFNLIIAGQGNINEKLITSNTSIMNYFIDDEKLSEILMKSDIVVLPYLSATQSGVAHHAFSYCKPVIATKVGGLPEIVNNKVGELVKKGSVTELKQAIEDISNIQRYNQLTMNIQDQSLLINESIVKDLERIYK